MDRCAGILLPIFSLPSKYGMGCFSKEAYDFVDFLVDAKQKFWQILPLTPTTYGDSPYKSVSSYAGNPYYICLEDFIEDGLISKSELENTDFGSDESYIDYVKMYETRIPLLKKIFRNSINENNISSIEEKEEYKKFIYEEGYWVESYALFMCIKEKENLKDLWDWDKKYIQREKNVIEDLYNNEEDFFNIRFYRFVQFEFNYQWQKLKNYANSKGIKFIGDIPFYVSLDSVECWCDRKNFLLDDDLNPKVVAGCPPDAFTEDGQLWGNPIYDWEYLKNNDYTFWIERLKKNFKLYDILRIDHFRAFDSYYEITCPATNAKNGVWKQGPGIDFFDTVYKKLGDKEIIAEDLGIITDSVRDLRKKTGCPGMRIIQFAFDDNDTNGYNLYLPHNYEENTVAYTGTHDNETLVQWINNLSENKEKQVRNYLQNFDTKKENLYKNLIALVESSIAKYAIIPIQDYLGLSKEARINFPSTVGNNWKWRIKKEMINDNLISEIRNMTEKYRR